MEKKHKKLKIPISKYKDKLKWSALRKAQYIFYKEHIVKISSGGRLLDVGSGAHQFEDLYKDLNKTSIDFAPYEGTDVIHDIETGLPFEDDTYDVVTIANTLEHIYQPQKLLKECYRVTRKGGIIIGATPFQLMVHQEPFDYFRYTNFALSKLLVDAGYSDVEIVATGTPIDVLFQTTNHFFSTLEKEKKSYFVRIFWKVHAILLILIKLVFGNLNPSLKYTLGYGFIAKKL